MVSVCYWRKCSVIHILSFKTYFIISHPLVPDVYVVLCFLLNSDFCSVTVLLHLPLCSFGVRILSTCVRLFNSFIACV
jgi:hypothetical protein